MEEFGGGWDGGRRDEVKFPHVGKSLCANHASYWRATVAVYTQHVCDTRECGERVRFSTKLAGVCRTGDGLVGYTKRLNGSRYGVVGRLVTILYTHD